MQKDITGQKFNRLTAIRFDHYDKNNNNNYWLFRCECGKEILTQKSCVIHGYNKSCGCLAIKKFLERNKKNPYKKHGMYKTRFYRIWHGIKNRCLNKKVKEYKYYGGRGIKICDRWLNSFENFKDEKMICMKII